MYINIPCCPNCDYGKECSSDGVKNNKEKNE